MLNKSDAIRRIIVMLCILAPFVPFYIATIPFETTVQFEARVANKIDRVLIVRKNLFGEVVISKSMQLDEKWSLCSLKFFGPILLIDFSNFEAELDKSTRYIKDQQYVIKQKNIYEQVIYDKKMKVYDFSNGKKAVDYEIEKLVFLRAYGAESIGASDNIICK